MSSMKGLRSEQSVGAFSCLPFWCVLAKPDQRLLDDEMTLERTSNEPNEDLDDSRDSHQDPVEEVGELEESAARIDQLFDSLNDRIDSLTIRPDQPIPQSLLEEDADLLDPGKSVSDPRLVSDLSCHLNRIR